MSNNADTPVYAAKVPGMPGYGATLAAAKEGMSDYLAAKKAKADAQPSLPLEATR